MLHHGRLDQNRKQTIYTSLDQRKTISISLFRSGREGRGGEGKGGEGKGGEGGGERRVRDSLSRDSVTDLLLTYEQSFLHKPSAALHPKYYRAIKDKFKFPSSQPA